MANTYSQVNLHFVFSPKHRNALIHPDWEINLYKYITGIVQKNNHKMLSINGMPDHIHIFIGFQTTQSMADLMQDVKADSSQWINQNNLTKTKFEWQKGYGVFSYSRSQVPQVINYIQNQKTHHKSTNFSDEYRSFLEKFQVEYDEKYIFHLPQ